MAQSATPITKSTKRPVQRPTAGPVVAKVQKRPRRDFVEAVWALFCSIKFAVVLNISLALAAMVGTIIPQMQPGILDFPGQLDQFMADAESRYGDLTGVMHWAGFFDLFNSLWFRLLVVTTVFSIVICTLNRWQPTLRLITRPTVRASDGFLSGLSEKAQFRAVPVSPESATQALTGALRKGRYRAIVDQSAGDGVVHLYADRDRWSKMVTFVSHGALVTLILVAAGIAFSGWRERSVIFNPNTPVDVGHGVDFKVANVGFSVEYYPNSSTVKQYYNTLAVYEGGTQVLTKTIIVNDPLRYKGVTFFLVSYQPVLYATALDSKHNAIQLRKMGASGPITTTSTTGETLLDFPYQDTNDNLPMDLVQFTVPNHIVTLEMTYYQDVGRLPSENPPAYVRAYLDQNFDKPLYDGFLPRTGPFSVPGYGDYSFTFRQSTQTILEVAADPGLGLVGSIFAVMALGFTISLYTTFTRCWAKIEPNEERPGTINIVLGGLAEKNKVTFERDFQKLATRVKQNLGMATRAPSAGATPVELATLDDAADEQASVAGSVTTDQAAAGDG
jgi:cytochrome c biogenesis protein